MVETRRRHVSVKAAAFTLTVAILALSTFSFIPAHSPAASASSPSSPYSWNPKVPCAPLVVRIEDITANQTGSASFSASAFSPGTTPPVSGGDSKRWLTPGTTPQGWTAPGPSCTVTNSKGTTSLFVEIDGLQRTSLTNEDWSNLYDPSNGGTFHSTLTGDTTFNLFDPKVVPNYSISCTSPTDPTCYGRIHGEIDHDWKAAGYCGPGTACDNATLASQTSSASTLIDVQGFIYWDAGAVAADWHQFNGWEIHPLTAWKLDNSPPPVPFRVSASPANPQVGQPVIFTATPQNGTTQASFNWNFGDGVTAAGSSVSHIFVTAQTFTVYATMTRADGASFTTWIVVPVGSWNQSVACSPAATTLEGVIGSVSIDRTPSNSSTAGADYSGGGFRLDGNLPYGSNPLTWPFFRRDLQPLCSVNGTSALVEFHNVTVINLSKDNCGTTYQNGTSYPNGWQSCDTTFSLATPGFGDDSCPACYMHRIYAGIDRDWNASGIAPVPPKEGQRIDVQGFVFWNNANLNATWHSYSGWEIHPISSWRLTHMPIVAGVTFTPSNPTSAQTVTFNGTASGGTGPYTFNWDFGDGKTAAGSTTSHTYATGSYTVHVSATDSHGAVGTASQNITVRIPPDFTLSVSPGSVAFPAGSSVSVGVNVSSLHAFNGNVSLTVTAPTGITGSFNQTSVALAPGDSAGSTLTFSSLTPGTHTVTVTGSSDLLSHSANVTVTVVDVGPTVGFSESTNTASKDETITMTISSSDIDGTVTSLSVSWGDGITDSLPGNAVTDSHVYVTSGTFTVNVTSTDDAGLSSKATTTNTITDAPPAARFTQSATTAPTGTAISFDGTTSSDPDGTIVSYAWDFGDGSTANGVNVSHSYGLAGNYTVTLTVTDNATLTGSTSSITRITDRPPVVSLALSSTGPPTGTALTLTINATDPDGALTGITVSWGDGATDTLPGNMTSDSHAYTLAGSYAILVNATDDAGLTTSSSSSIIITDRPPVVSFTESANNAPTGTPITLMINATDPDGVLSGVTVNWGDGTIDSLLGNATIAIHTYFLAESYTVTVSATDDAGLTASSQSANAISDRPPSLNITENTTTAPTGTQITVTITASDPDGTISQIQVVWGDGSMDSLPGNATGDSHFFSIAGLYSVHVNATDDAGLTTSSAASLTITDRPPAVTFTQSTASALRDQTVTLTVSSSDPDGAVTGLRIDWGDGTGDVLPGNSTMDSHAYITAGIFTLNVTVTDNAGLSTSATGLETITDAPPVAAFTQSQSTVPTGAPISFDSSTSSDSDGTIVSYSWNFGDGSTASGTIVSHSYGFAGNYSVTLMVTDNATLTASTTTLVRVLDRPATVSITASTTNSPTGSPITLTLNATDPDGSVTSLIVSWGDGTTNALPGNVTSTNHAYSLAGSYTVYVNATDDAGLTATSPPVIESISNRPPVVSLSPSAQTVPTGTSITLTINATDLDGFVTGITVNWGDGAIDNLAGNATADTHSYILAGSYTATVTATDDARLTGNSQSTITITDRPPVVSFTGSANTVSTGTVVTLTINATDPDGTISTLIVSWGDGTVDSLPGSAISDSHSYSISGNYSVYVNATDNANLTTQSSMASLTITDRPPTVSLNESTSTAFRDQTLTLTISSSDPDGSITSLRVDWGDGTIDILPDTSTTDTHAYVLAGTFAINATATDNNGLSTSATTVNSIVDAPPTVSLTASPGSANTGQSVTLTISSQDSDGTITQTVVDWGDGTSDSFSGAAITDTHAYTGTGSAKSQAATVSVTVTDNATLTATGNTLVTINDLPPTASFRSSTASALTGENISFNATATSDPDGSITSYSWDFGDGSTGTGIVVSHSYTSTGNSATQAFTVTLTATDNSGNTATTAFVEMISDRNPVATFTPSAQTTLTGTSVTFNATASADPDGSVLTYSWSFGDGNTGTGAIVSHAYSSTGNALSQVFMVSLTITDNSGNTGDASAIVTVNDRTPAASFTQSTSSTPTGASVGFNASSSIDPDGTILSYAWNFGDGNTGTGIIVNHSYASTGNSLSQTFTVTLTVTDNSGNSGTVSGSVTVTDRPPIASFASTKPVTQTLTSITFVATGSSDPDGTITSYSWTFGDGGTALGPIVTHSYSTTGNSMVANYTVTLTVRDNSGRTATTQSTETISDRPPTASFNESASSTTTGSTITFNASASSDPDGTVSTYSWTFGDGGTATGSTATHSYESTGNAQTATFTVTLTVADNGGDTGSSSTAETISDRPPTASFTTSPTSPFTGTGVTFNATASNDPDGSVVGYAWNFGDGSTGSGMAVSHSYTIAGTYVVSLAVTDNTGNTATSIAPFTVQDRPPVAAFSFNPANPHQAQTIGFNATSSSDQDGTVTGYAWDFGDGSPAGSGSTTSHVYSVDGNYTVTLTVTDNSGCTGTAITRITVRLDKPPSWGPDGSLTVQEIQESANGSSLNLSWTPATDDGAISLYLIYVNGALRATVEANVTQYTLSGLAPGSYQLRVEAVDDAGFTSTNALTTTVEVGGSGGSRYAS